MPATLPLSYTTVTRLNMMAPQIGSLTALTSGDVHQFAARAQATINAMVAQQYVLPLVVEVPVIQNLCEDLGLFYIFRRIYTTEQFDKSPWPLAYVDIMAALERIATGDDQLFDSTGTILVARTDIRPLWSNNQGFTPVYSQLTDMEAEVDPAKTDYERSRRP